MEATMWSSRLVRAALTLGILTIAGYAEAQSSSLVGRWKFDETSGTTAIDGSGRGNDGTLVNSPVSIAPGFRGGRALSFDGVNDYVEIGDRPDLKITGPLTLSGWFKTSAPLGNFKTLVSKWWSGGTAASYSMAWNDAGLYFAIHNDANQMLSAQSSLLFNDGAWHHAVGTWDGSTIRLYVDGILRASSPGPAFGAISDTTFPVRIGTDARYTHDGNDRLFPGVIDEVRIYNQGLSAGEVTELFTLTHHWLADGDAIDSAGSNDGTLQGGAAFAAGHEGQAFDFDGVDDYVDAGPVPEINGQSYLTIAFWVNFDSLHLFSGIVSKRLDDTNRVGVSLDTNHRHGIDEAGLLIGNGENSFGYTNANVAKIGEWHHWAMVFDGTQEGNADRLKFYYDGVQLPLAYFGTIPATTPVNAANFLIGKEDLSFRELDGRVDDVRLYNTALSAAEIAAIIGTPSNNARLSALSLSPGTLSPAFSADVTSYTASVTNDVTSVQVTATTEDSHATRTITGGSNLAVGSNMITIVVTAQDGTTTKSYTINVTRAASSNANLSALGLNPGTLTPSFAVNTTSYTASVAGEVASTQVTATPADPNATVTINGGTATTVSLNSGSNTITVLVTAPDGTTTKTYSVSVTRAAVAVTLAFATQPGDGHPGFPLPQQPVVEIRDAFGNRVTGAAATVTLSLRNSIGPLTCTANPVVTTNGIATFSGCAISTTGAHRLVATAAGLTSALSLPFGVAARTYRVNSEFFDQVDSNPGDGICAAEIFGTHCTLTAAITEANHAGSGTVILVTSSRVNAGSHIGAGPQIVITGSMAIAGEGMQATQIERSQGGPILHVQSGTVSISDLRLKNGGANSGGAVLNTATVTIDRVHFQFNGAFAAGGAIHNTGTLTVNDSLFEGNTVAQLNSGAAIANTGSLTVNRSTFSRHCGSIKNTGTLNVNDSVFDDNQCGGGTSVDGGAINTGGGEAFIHGCTFTRNNAASGGAVFQSAGRLTITDSLFRGNRAFVGGALAVLGGFASVTGCTFTANTADGSGGGISNGGSGVTSNSPPGGQLSIMNSTISGNHARYLGGALNIIRGSGTFTGVHNTTIVGNGARSRFEVSGAQEGGQIHGLMNVIRGSIIAYPDHNSASSSPTENCAGAGAQTGSQGFNLVTDATCGFADLTDRVTSDVGLGPLADNGGPTSTHLPQPGSPAINTGPFGTCPQYDQRGMARPLGGRCEIGAVEVPGGPPNAAELGRLSVSPAMIAPAFSPYTLSYTASVPHFTASVSVLAEAQGTGTVAINGVAATSRQISLQNGDNVIEVVVSAADGSVKTYTVTVTRAPSDPKLTSLSVLQTNFSPISLSPVFATDTLSYTASTSFANSQVIVRASGSEGTVTINGVSGTQRQLPLDFGPNTITVVVTGDDGNTKVYTVTVTRNPEPKLSALGISSGTLSPAFSPGVTAYSASVPNEVASVTITATPADAAFTVFINGSNTQTRLVSLSVGSNAITVIVTTTDGARRTYSLNIYRSLSSNSRLSSLTLRTGSGESVPLSFDAGTLNYAVQVAGRVTTLSITATCEDSLASVAVNGATPTRTTVTSNVTLSPRTTSISITVAAQDRSTRTYSVTVSRLRTAELASMSLSTGSTAVALTPAFSPAATDYSCTLASVTTSLTLTATTDYVDASAYLSVNGTAIPTWRSGQTATIAIRAGVNTISLRVFDTLPDSSTVTKTYTITATRPASTDADLVGLTLGGPALSPAFSSGTTAYSASVASDTANVNVSATTSHSGATVSINAAAGSSRTVALGTGWNTMSIVVTAENGTTKTYTVSVFRASATNAKLASIMLDGGAVALSPAFAEDVTSYNAVVPETTVDVAIAAVAKDPAATITINGQPVSSTSIVPGGNPVVIGVTAPDGVTQKTYSVTVTHPARSAPPRLADLGVTTFGDPMTPAFSPEITSYTAGGSVDAPSAYAWATAQETSSSLILNGVPSPTSGSGSLTLDPLQPGSNLIMVEVVASDGATNTYTLDVVQPEAPPAAAVGRMQVVATGTTAPLVRASLFVDGRPHHPNAWTNRDVTVHFTCIVQGGASLDANGCPADRVVTTPGEQFVASGPVCDTAGQCTPGVSVRVRIDRTAPAVTVPAQLSATTAGAGAVVAFNATATDAQSGLLRDPQCTPESGAFFPVGTTNVTCYAFDLAHNRGEISFPVTVDFAGAPRLVDVPLDIVTEATGEAGAVVQYVPPTASDGSAVTCLPASGTTFPIGRTNVSCAAGTLRASFTITVVDITPPVLRATLTAGGEPYAANSWTNRDVTASFTCTGATACPPTQTFSTEGEHVASSGAVCDTAGNCTSLMFRILIDRTLPVLTVPSERRSTTNSTGTTVVFEASAADSLSGIARAFCSPSSGSFFALGSTLVTCLAADHAGNSTSRTFNVFVDIDTSPRLADVPPDITVDADDESGASVSYSLPTAPGGESVTCSPASDSLFPIGTTPVTCTSGTLTASFNITVRRAGAPLLSGIPSTMVVDAMSPAGAVVSYVAPTAANSSGVTVPVNCSPASGELFPIGSTTVTCSATDSSVTATADFIIIVVDSSGPAISGIPASQTVEATSAAGATVNYALPSATDLVSGAVAVICAPTSGSTFPLSRTTVACTAQDAAGNTTIEAFEIAVVDTTAPVISPPPEVTAEAISASGAVVSYGAPTASDAVGVVGLTCHPASGSVFAVGDTRVTCTAHDAAGNFGSASFTVSVRVTVPPTLMVPSTVIAEATSSNGAMVSYQATATDALGVSLTPTCSPASGARFALGDTIVRCSATDVRSMASIRTFVVSVRDTTPPSITAPPDLTLEANSPGGAIVTYIVSAADVVDPHPTVVCSRPSGSSFALGTTAVSCSATDSRGNRSSAGFGITVRDTIAPRVTCSSADGAWHATNVNITCSASDGGSGLLHAANANFVLSTSVAAGDEPANAPTGSRAVCDRANNCTPAGPISGNKVDRKPPSIIITVPAANATYTVGQSATASFHCSDGGSGVQTCTGSAVDTSSTASRSVVVNASDNVGNTSSQSAPYNVTYAIALLFDNTKPVKSGATLPIKIQLTSAAGANLSSSSVVVTAQSVTKISDQTSGDPVDPGNSNPDDNFRFSDASYIYNLKTANFAIGTYALKFAVTGDPVVHSLTFQVR
jgi:hypothetical protein